MAAISPLHLDVWKAYLDPLLEKHENKDTKITYDDLKSSKEAAEAKIEAASEDASAAEIVSGLVFLILSITYHDTIRKRN